MAKISIRSASLADVELFTALSSRSVKLFTALSLSVELFTALSLNSVELFTALSCIHSTAVSFDSSGKTALTFEMR